MGLPLLMNKMVVEQKAERELELDDDPGGRRMRDLSIPSPSPFTRRWAALRREPRTDHRVPAFALELHWKYLQGRQSVEGPKKEVCGRDGDYIYTEEAR